MDDHHRSPQNPIPFHPDDAEHWRHPRPFRHTHPHQHPTTSRDAHAHTHGLDRDHHQIERPPDEATVGMVASGVLDRDHTSH